MNLRKLLLLLWLLTVLVVMFVLITMRPTVTVLTGEWMCTGFDAEENCTVLSKL